jgi:hypothetical protein
MYTNIGHFSRFRQKIHYKAFEGQLLYRHGIKIRSEIVNKIKILILSMYFINFNLRLSCSSRVEQSWTFFERVSLMLLISDDA